MLYRILASAVAAGMLAAVLISLVQEVTTTPLIFKAETYESSTPAHDPQKKTARDVEPEQEAWTPEDGFERFMYTLFANAVTGVGFALLLIVGLTFQKSNVDATRGLLWGIAGFSVFTLAPALGLPPEVPGIPAADLLLRQGWWLITVLSAAIGLACMVFGKTSAIKALGLVIIATPHIWGAPHIGEIKSIVPPDLSARFAASTITVNALFWAMIGLFSGVFYCRLGKGKHAA